jgi:hypothetical protein
MPILSVTCHVFITLKNVLNRVVEINETHFMLNINFPQVYSLEDKQKGTSAPQFLCCVYISKSHIQHVDTFKFRLKSCKTNRLCMEAYVHFSA